MLYHNSMNTGFNDTTNKKTYMKAKPNMTYRRTNDIKRNYNKSYNMNQVTSLSQQIKIQNDVMSTIMNNLSNQMNVLAHQYCSQNGTLHTMMQATNKLSSGMDSNNEYLKILKNRISALEDDINSLKKNHDKETNERTDKLQGITITPISPMPFNVPHKILKKQTDKPPGDKENHTDPNIEFAGGKEMFPLVMFGELMNRMFDSDKEKEKENSVMNDIKLPDSKRTIYKNSETDVINDFVELEIKNLNDIVKHGQEFIQLMEKHNSEMSNTKNRRHAKSESLQKLSKGSPDANIIKNKNKNKNGNNKNISTKHDPDKYHILNIIIDEISKINTDDNNNDNSIDGLYSFLGKKYSIDPRKLMKLVQPIQILNSMIGMTDVKKNIFQFVSSFLQEKKRDGMMNTAIYGKPGIGKTDLGKILCMIYSALNIVPSSRFTLVRASDLIGQYVGQTRQKTLKVLRDSEGGVLFIDEAYTLTNGTGDKYSYGKECIDTLNQELSENRRKLVVIIAGYENEIKEGFFKINQGLSRRFPFRYVLKEYSKEELKDIFMRMLRLTDNLYLDKSVKDDDIINLFSDMKYFDNCGGDIENLLTHIGFANHERSVGKHPGTRNIFNIDDIKKGYEMFKYHKSEENNDNWKKMFV